MLPPPYTHELLSFSDLYIVPADTITQEDLKKNTFSYFKIFTLDLTNTLHVFQCIFLVVVSLLVHEDIHTCIGKRQINTAVKFTNIAWKCRLQDLEKLLP